MREGEFRRWLEHDYVSKSGEALSPTTINTQLSVCRRIETHEGDLDDHYRRDGMADLIARFQYSKRESRAGRVVRHHIPLAGADIYSNTAFFRHTVQLYLQYCRSPHPGTTTRTVEARTRPAAHRTSDVAGRDRSVWETPSEADLLHFARLVTPYVRFLAPVLVSAIVEDNEAHRVEWGLRLGAAGIDPELYLWERCATVFPGVRRRGGSEMARQHQRLEADEARQRHAFWLDDNRYPRMTWSLALRGNKSGLRTPGYQLAHLADHKPFGNRADEEATGDLADAEHARLESDGIPGLFTSAANVVFVPQALLKATDAPGPLRRLMQRRAQKLFRTCRLLPPPLELRLPDSPEWEDEAFDWPETSGEARNIPALLEFRARELERLFMAAGAPIA
jgi:hypothetical protein